MMAGHIICAGLGPGEPDLISLRADRAIRAARAVAWFCKAGRQGQARRMVEGMLRPDAVEFPMEYPLTTELPPDHPDYIARMAAFYDACAVRLVEMAATSDVVVLCEGEPFLYGSFMHLQTRLQGRIPIEVIPGIPGMVGCWNAIGQPVTWGDDALIVLPGTLPQAELTARMGAAEAIVVMKLGRNLPKVRRALAEAGRLPDAFLVEHGTMPGQRITPLADHPGGDCPYFALIVVHGHGRRPEAGGAA